MRTPCSPGPGLLADVVVPISYAVKRTALAGDLCATNPGRCRAPRAASLLALLVAFLHDHGGCVWPHGRMPRPAGYPRPAGWPWCRPDAAAWDPPLLELTRRTCGCVDRLVIRPGARAASWTCTGSAPTGGGSQRAAARGQLVSGASAQSAAAALKLAGARHVAIVVLGRHLDPADPAARR